MSAHVCTRPACAIRAEEQQPGESREAWLARLGEIVRASVEDACVNEHPWTIENTAYTSQGSRQCRECKRTTSREAKRRKAAAA